MKTANVAEFKKHLSSYLEMAERGETIQVCRRNVPIAELKGLNRGRNNQTQLGCGKGSVVFHSSVTDPFIPEDSWDMLSGDLE